jgi:hypothetical protein
VQGFAPTIAAPWLPGGFAVVDLRLKSQDLADGGIHKIETISFTFL